MSHLASPRRGGSDAVYAGAAGVAFVALAGAVVRGATQRVDRAVDCRHPHPRHGVRHAMAAAVKVAGQPQTQLGLAALTTIGLRRGSVTGANAVVSAAVGAFLADKACKRLVHRRRPPGYRGDEEAQSFPSGHTASAAALAVTLAVVLARQGLVRPIAGTLVAATYIAFVGETRLLLGEHWASDVMAGALLGSAVACGALATTAPDGRPSGAAARHAVATRRSKAFSALMRESPRPARVSTVRIAP